MIHLPFTSFLELVRTTVAALLECEVLTGEVIQILDLLFLVLRRLF